MHRAPILRDLPISVFDVHGDDQVGRIAFTNDRAVRALEKGRKMSDELYRQPTRPGVDKLLPLSYDSLSFSTHYVPTSSAPFSCQHILQAHPY